MVKSCDFYPELHKLKVSLNMCVNYCLCETVDLEILVNFLLNNRIENEIIYFVITL